MNEIRVARGTWDLILTGDVITCIQKRLQRKAS
jgi:hypothetical protein